MIVRRRGEVCSGRMCRKQRLCGVSGPGKPCAIVSIAVSWIVFATGMTAIIEFLAQCSSDLWCAYDRASWVPRKDQFVRYSLAADANGPIGLMHFRPMQAVDGGGDT